MSAKDITPTPLADPVAKACPICGKPQVAARRPFCSKRCADVDLGHWFNESYAIPTLEAPDDYDDDGGGEALDGSEG